MTIKGFPDGSVVKNLPASAGDASSIPDPGRCHMPRETKPMHHNFWAWALEPQSLDGKPAWEAAAPQLKISPCSPQIEKSPRGNEGPAQPKIN